MWSKKNNKSTKSNVDQSFINGNIKVDGIDLTVYDDSNLVTTINSKANSNHDHKLENITDIDITNKTNGYSLQYDSTLNKFVSKALPNGTGSGATNLDGLSDVDTSTTAPVEGNVLLFKGGIWKPEAPTYNPSSSNVYMIELSRWGIIQGIPQKPYVTADYNKANVNITGINNALSWAYTNGYDYVTFPRGDYAICYPNPILTQPNITIDFNHSTFKVIYDSDARSPFDTSVDPTYRFGGTSIVCTTPNTHIINLKLIGDRIDRSWTNLENERSFDFSYGISFGSGADNSSVRYCDISYFMADAIGTGFSPYEPFEIGNTELGGLDAAGQPVTGVTTKTVRSINYVTLPSNTDAFTMIGLGYAPTTSIPSQTYSAFFYTSDDVFIYKKLNIRTRDKVFIPKGAVKLKLSWEGDGTPDGGTYPSNPPYWVILIKHGLSDRVIIEHNEIHRCHRGGIIIGTNNVTIRNNYIHDTAVEDSTFATLDLDGIPIFSDFTRYGIGIEDNVGHNCKIIDNVIDNVRMAMAVRGEHIEIAGNEIRNCVSGIVLYHQKHALISKNFFYYSSIGCFEYTDLYRDWIITDNIFQSSLISFPGSGSISNFSNNTLVDNSKIGTYVYILNFKNNTFDNSKCIVNEIETIIDGCSFINDDAGIEVYSKDKPYDKIIRCNFTNGSYVLGQNSNQIIVRDSAFIDGYIHYKSQTSTYTLINCKINNILRPVITNQNPLEYTTTNILEIKNSNISLGLVTQPWQASKSYSIGDTIIPPTPNGYYYKCYTGGNSGATEPTWVTSGTLDIGATSWDVYPLVKVPIIYAFGWGKLIIDNSTINFNIVTDFLNSSFAGVYYDIKDSLEITNSIISAYPAIASYKADKSNEIILSNNTFTNFSITNPKVEIQSDKMSAEPTVGTFKLAQQVLNSNPTSGGSLGWICTTAGVANKTAWTSSTAYTIGTFVNTNGKVYKCTVAGTSSTTAPSHTAGTDTDGTTLTWEYVNNLAVFKTFGLIN